MQAPVYPQVPVRSSVSKLAIWSLVTGILSLFCSFLTGIPAVIMGILSLKKIKNSNGTLGGGGMAIAGITTGIVCGLLGLASLAALAAPIMIRQRHKAEAIAISANIREFHVHAIEYSIEHGGVFPDQTTATQLLAGVKVGHLSTGNWRYFPQASDSTTNEILLISPATPDTLVLHVDGSIESLKDKEEVRKLIDSSRTPPAEIPATRR